MLCGRRKNFDPENRQDIFFLNLKTSPLEMLDKNFQGICPNVKSRIDIVQGISKAYIKYCWWDKLPNAEILKSDK